MQVTLPDFGLIHIGSGLPSGRVDGQYFFDEEEFYRGEDLQARRALRIMCSEAARTIGLRYYVRIGDLSFREDVLFASMKGLRTQSAIASNLVMWLMKNKELEDEQIRTEKIVAEVKRRQLEKQERLHKRNEEMKAQEEEKSYQRKVARVIRQVEQRREEAAMLLPEYECTSEPIYVPMNVDMRADSIVAGSGIKDCYEESVKAEMEFMTDSVLSVFRHSYDVYFHSSFKARGSLLELCWRKNFPYSSFKVIWPDNNNYYFDEFIASDFEEWRYVVLHGFYQAVKQFQEVGGSFTVDGYIAPALRPFIFYDFNIIEKPVRGLKRNRLNGWVLGDLGLWEELVWSFDELMNEMEQWPFFQYKDSNYSNSDCQIVIKIGSLYYKWHWGWKPSSLGYGSPSEFARQCLSQISRIRIYVFIGNTVFSGHVTLLYNVLLVFKGSVRITDARICSDKYLSNDDSEVIRNYNWT